MGKLTMFCRSTEQDDLDEESADSFTFGKSDVENEMRSLSDKEKLVKIFNSLVRHTSSFNVQRCIELTG